MRNRSVIQADITGHPVLAAQIHHAASAGFIHGFSAGYLAATEM
jgi:hypothetical protein